MPSECRATAIEYTCTKFGVDSSSRFPFRARTNRQTNRQTRLNALPTPTAIQPVWVNTDGIVLAIHRACRFNNRIFRCLAATLVKSLTHMMCLCSPSINWYRPTAVTLWSWEGNRGPGRTAGLLLGLWLMSPAACLPRKPEICTDQYGPLP